MLTFVVVLAWRVARRHRREQIAVPSRRHFHFFNVLAKYCQEPVFACQYSRLDPRWYALKQQRQTEHSAACIVEVWPMLNADSCKVQIIKLGKSHTASRIIFRWRRPRWISSLAGQAKFYFQRQRLAKKKIRRRQRLRRLRGLHVAFKVCF